MKTRIIRANGGASFPRLLPRASLGVNLLFTALLTLIAVALLPKTLVAAVGAGLSVGMIIDAQLLYSDAQALTVTAVSTNVVDHGSDRNLGIGEPLAIVLTVDVAAAGGGTLQVTLQADDNVGFASPGTVAQTAAIAAAVLVAGAKVIIPIPPDINMERFSRLSYALVTMTGITVTAFMEPLKAVGAGDNVFYADAVTIG